jgi:hypothetical protein
LKPQKNDTEKKNDRAGKPGKARGPVQRDAKEVMAELVAKLSQKLDSQLVGPYEAQKVNRTPRPNRDRLTVGLDLGDRWSNYCILGMDGVHHSQAALASNGAMAFTAAIMAVDPSTVEPRNLRLSSATSAIFIFE